MRSYQELVTSSRFRASDRRWEPAMDAGTRSAGIARWHEGVEPSLGWVDSLA